MFISAVARPTANHLTIGERSIVYPAPALPFMGPLGVLLLAIVSNAAVSGASIFPAVHFLAVTRECAISAQSHASSERVISAKAIVRLTRDGISLGGAGHGKQQRPRPPHCSASLRAQDSHAHELMSGDEHIPVFYGGLGLILSVGLLDYVMVVYKVVGHTKFGPDLIARQIASVYNSSDAFKHMQLVRMMTPYATAGEYDDKVLHIWEKGP